MMNEGGWFGMGGMWFYWSIPLLIGALVAVAWILTRGRSREGR